MQRFTVPPLFHSSQCRRTPRGRAGFFYHYDSPTARDFSRSLKGLCHQIKIAWKWYCFKGLGMDMRRLILKKILSEPSIFNRHLKFLCLGSKSVQIFDFVLNLSWGCSRCVQIALFVSWNNSDFLCLFQSGCLISRIFYNHCSISWKLLELLFVGFEQKLRIILSSISVQDLNRAAPAKFGTQIEQIRTHIEQPQIRFRTKWKINAFWASA